MTVGGACLASCPFVLAGLDTSGGLQSYVYQNIFNDDFVVEHF